MRTENAEITKGKRHDEILAVAADIFWEKGYHATSINDIAGATGLRKASLYHHVRSKEAILYEMSATSMRNMLKSLARARGDTPEALLADIIHKHLEAMLLYRSAHATALYELRALSAGNRQHIVDLRARYDSVIDETIRRIQESTGRWPGIPIYLVRLGLLGMLNWSAFWFDPDGPKTSREVATAFTSIFLQSKP